MLTTTKIKQNRQPKLNEQILIGNGTHQAICDVKAKLIKTDNTYQLIFPDDYEVSVQFRNKKLIKKYIENSQDFENGLIADTYFLGYPKVNKHGIVKKIAIVKINQKQTLLPNKKQPEIYKITGVWTKDNIIIVQRDFKLMMEFFKKKGILPTYTYQVNCPDKIKNSLLLDNVYELLLNRNKSGQLIVKEVIK